MSTCRRLTRCLLVLVLLSVTHPTFANLFDLVFGQLPNGIAQEVFPLVETSYRSIGGSPYPNAGSLAQDINVYSIVRDPITGRIVAFSGGKQTPFGVKIVVSATDGAGGKPLMKEFLAGRGKIPNCYGEVSGVPLVYALRDENCKIIPIDKVREIMPNKNISPVTPAELAAEIASGHIPNDPRVTPDCAYKRTIAGVERVKVMVGNPTALSEPCPSAAGAGPKGRGLPGSSLIPMITAVPYLVLPESRNQTAGTLAGFCGAGYGANLAAGSSTPWLAQTGNIASKGLRGAGLVFGAVQVTQIESLENDTKRAVWHLTGNRQVPAVTSGMNSARNGMVWLFRGTENYNAFVNYGNRFKHNLNPGNWDWSWVQYMHPGDIPPGF